VLEENKWKGEEAEKGGFQSGAYLVLVHIRVDYVTDLPATNSPATRRHTRYLVEVTQLSQPWKNNN
jgi:hypothetical protein